jgi:hypothetical protein
MPPEMQVQVSEEKPQGIEGGSMGRYWRLLLSGVEALSLSRAKSIFLK